MNHWFRQLYLSLPCKTYLNHYFQITFHPYTKYWYWRIVYSGFCFDEYYSRLIEHIGRHLLLVPALCIGDKFVSTYMNAVFAKTIFKRLSAYTLYTNLTPLQYTKFITLGILGITLLWNILLLF